ncbi:hypothetical protein, partial [Sansalvadorimonas verongulae]|uniref:hypothetical protein n=1 Tax=Sansalvadorimonas verongulae TaxID=2172824 RepID=UPI0018AD1C9B
VITEQTKYTIDLRITDGTVLDLYSGWLDFYHKHPPIATATLLLVEGERKVTAPVKQQEATPLQLLHRMDYDYKGALSFHKSARKH